jgi:hypothetical protein
MKIKRFFLLLVPFLFAAASTATAGFAPVVLAVGDTTITAQTSAKAGAKMPASRIIDCRCSKFISRDYLRSRLGNPRLN